MLRTQAGASPSASAVRSEILKLDRDQPRSAVGSMTQILADSVAARRFQMLLIGLFSAVALLLAAVGIYGMISFAVAQRTHEIGVRMALGARKRDVLSLVVREGMVLVFMGLILGTLGGMVAARILASQLFGIATTDPLTFTTVSILLATVALAACWLPAQRAARVDPMVALRQE